MPWMDVALPIIEEAPTIAEGLLALFTHLHNEMKNGQGQTNPVGVVEEGLVGVGKLAAALEANTSGHPATTDDTSNGGQSGNQDTATGGGADNSA